MAGSAISLRRQNIAPGDPIAAFKDPVDLLECEAFRLRVEE